MNTNNTAANEFIILDCIVDLLYLEIVDDALSPKISKDLICQPAKTSCQLQRAMREMLVRQSQLIEPALRCSICAHNQRTKKNE